MAKIEGTVNVTFMVDGEGNTNNPNIENGHPMLRQAVLDAINKWTGSLRCGLRPGDDRDNHRRLSSPPEWV